ncbi:MAG TPA: glycoside hydrolase family 3 N-terminal domain-containing protein [Pseudonocardiaceae bacterium]
MTSLRRHLNWVTLVATILTAAVAAPVNQSVTLTPQQEAGQRIIYSYTGLTPPAALIQRIEAGQAAGVIFFGDNISSDNQISSVVGQLRQAAAQSPVHAPLLLMTDQEGGQVRRLPGSPVQSEKQIGQSADAVTVAGQAGHDAGENLRSVGMNVNLAPVLDVYYQAGNFIDEFQRSYSNDAATVSSLGQAFVGNQQPVGVAATAKHFPGLGAATTSQNTDAQPVTLNVSLSGLRAKDEAPYPAAIAAGVKLIMVSWATYPALDAGRPAGLSSAVVQGELRDRLGFQGVTVTDAIEAGGLKAFGGDGNRSVLAAQAGMDLILCADGTVTQGDNVNAALVDAMRSGRLGQSSFTAAVDRVTALRDTLP